MNKSQQSTEPNPASSSASFDVCVGTKNFEKDNIFEKSKILDSVVYSLLETLNPIFDREDNDSFLNKKVST